MTEKSGINISTFDEMVNGYDGEGEDDGMAELLIPLFEAQDTYAHIEEMWYID